MPYRPIGDLCPRFTPSLVRGKGKLPSVKSVPRYTKTIGKHSSARGPRDGANREAPCQSKQRQNSKRVVAPESQTSI